MTAPAAVCVIFPVLVFIAVISGYGFMVAVNVFSIGVSAILNISNMANMANMTITN